MQRRNFILNAVKAIPVLYFSPSLLASCGSADENETKIPASNKTIIVVGGGIAGLAAAKKLRDKGAKVIVLEAQSKVGGRLKTNRNLGFAFDEGASWIHGPNGNPITSLAQQSGANTFLTDDDSLKVFDSNGTAYSDAFLDLQYNQFEAAIEAVTAAGNLNQSFETVFQSLYATQSNSRLWKYMLSAYLEFNTGGDIANLSSKYFDDDEVFEGEDLIITNGYDKITDFLAKDLEVFLNQKVTEINYGEKIATVKANGIVYNADYVLVTVPLGVLKKNLITFNPVLPSEKSKAIQETNMGNVNKFLLTWNTAFWDEKTQYIGYTPNEKGKFNYFMNMKKFLPATNALMTFAFGNYATTTESMSDATIINEIMSHLKYIYGSAIPNPTQMLRTKWGSNGYSFGAYSYATNGTTSADFDAMALEINNKLFFAGEHTERDYRGTVHGAYISGIREADKILAL